MPDAIPPDSPATNALPADALSIDALPISDCLDELTSALAQAQSVVLQAPPGAGKTTGIPPALLNSNAVGDGKTLLIQPRRIAARAAASRLAAAMDCRVGDTVGYHVRFDKRYGKDTRLISMTTGMLLRRMQSDPFLENVSCVVLDEFHERSLEIDLALGMLQRVRTSLRPELRLLVMSATLSPEPIAQFLGDAHTMISKGRSFPVDVRYSKQISQEPVEQKIIHTLPKVLEQTTGHVLVFLPGVGEINRTQRAISSCSWSDNFQILRLYGDLPAKDQDEVLRDSKTRRVILSTNVAETSLTIPGVTGVIDSGLVRTMQMDSQIGLPKLQLEPISQASAEQRAGRAGRTSPGLCYRLWPLAVHRARPSKDTPEITRCDFASALLMLSVWGERDVFDFPWLTPPTTSSVKNAENLLKQLSAIDSEGRITKQGRHMASLPIHPRLARFMLEAETLKIVEEAALAVALLTERDPLRGVPSQSTVIHDCDLSDKVERVKTILSDQHSPHRQSPAIKNTKRIAEQIQKATRRRADTVPTTSPNVTTDHPLQRALLSAFPDRVAKRRDDDPRKGVMVGGRGVRQSKRSAAIRGDLFLCLDIDSQGKEASVHLASGLRRDWLDPNLLREIDEPCFNTDLSAVVARRRTYFADLLLSETPIGCQPDEETAAILTKHARQNMELCFPRNKKTNQFIERVRFLTHHMPELEIPDLDSQSIDEALVELCKTRTSFTELTKAPWLDHLRCRYQYDQMRLIDLHAPVAMTVPSGNEHSISYEQGKPPRMEIRIQELFGWKQTPQVATRVPIQLHLLGPNHRPQQITDDLANFWSETYLHVRKELRRRYPKHHWPEDPLNATPTRNGLKPKS
ncbi:MAG: ATP-dependent helicase HrpB [Rhodopirellula sp.]|nr:ATP-dependent helicase HrpB [Rhodopirellula sp.]